MSTYGSAVNKLDVFGEDSDYDVGRMLADEFIQKTGLESLPQVRPIADLPCVWCAEGSVSARLSLFFNTRKRGMLVRRLYREDAVLM